MDLIEQEQQILNIMKKKKLSEIPYMVCIKGLSENEILKFQGEIKSFKYLSRFYKREGNRIYLIFKVSK
ncbi:hypothetical protein BH747_04980 [Enterococcus villorum]|uniref:Uncharacterized protein n=1 Tax=Enterococcus villorum TaxID=112904 RepID=A0A1V8YDV3_9ENTE|nr:hypothetical protein [Enterococcus villorum]OQO70758.1 hypothetical protein BH747_04980 [Enterococcus villorum]OQO71906.1 hypothetical protein BH744_12820 [Enterococcus villorum]